MKTLTCDILVVGAGPAGTSAAREAASKGACVIVVESRAVIGVPVQCAEYIPAPLLGEVCLRPDFVVQPLRGMKTLLNGRTSRKSLPQVTPSAGTFSTSHWPKKQKRPGPQFCCQPKPYQEKAMRSS